MINHEFNEKRTGLANAFAAAGAELLGYMGSSSALAAIPDTDPPKYVAAGPLKEIAKLLPAFGDAAEQPTGDLTDEQIIKMHDAVFGWLDDGYKFVLRFARDIERAAIAAHLAGQSQATKVQAVPSLIEHDDWKIDGSLLYRLNDAGNANFDEINVTMANGSRKDDVRHKAALELLAGLAAPTAQEVTQQAAPTAWLATDLDGRGDVAFTKEEAKRRAGEGCTEFFPLYDVAPVTQQAAPDEVRQCVRDAVADALAGLYYCGRVWSAWSVGAMSQDDFSPADEDDDIIESVTDAALNAMVLANVTQQAAPVAVWTAEEIANACVKVGLGILECHGLLTTLKSIPAVTQQAAKAETAEFNEEYTAHLINRLSVANRREGWRGTPEYNNADRARAAQEVDSAERKLLEYVRSLAPTTSKAAEAAIVSAPLGYISDDAMAMLKMGRSITVAISTGKTSIASTPICEGAQGAPDEIRNAALVEGLEMAARHLDKQRQAVDQDHAYQEPDTGAWVFDRPETEEYSNTLAELADEIRALKRTSTDQADTDTGSAA